jgi:hypothetical protein
VNPSSTGANFHSPFANIVKLQEEQLKAEMPQGWHTLKGIPNSIKGKGYSSPTFGPDSNPQFVSQITIPNWNQEISQQIGININISSPVIQAIHASSLTPTEETWENKDKRKISSIEDFAQSGERKLNDRRNLALSMKNTEPMSPEKKEASNFKYTDVMAKVRKSKLVVTNETGSFESGRPISSIVRTSTEDLLDDAIKCSLKKARGGKNDLEKRGAKDKHVIKVAKLTPPRRGSRVE